MSRVRTRPYDVIKRSIDVLGACTALILSIPLQCTVAALIAVKLGRPVLFRQDRPGRDGVVFTLIKFRTMLDADSGKGLITDEQRLTPFGKKLRSSSLDELPTLLNVLRGDMSFVGPRPLLVQYLGRYTPEQSRRHEVRPGITGLAQVSGRNALSWDDKFALDVRYVNERSLVLDAQIMLRTFRTVVRRDGISSPDHVTAAEFLGSSKTGDQ